MVTMLKATTREVSRRNGRCELTVLCEMGAPQGRGETPAGEQILNARRYPEAKAPGGSKLRKAEGNLSCLSILFRDLNQPSTNQKKEDSHAE